MWLVKDLLSSASLHLEALSIHQVNFFYEQLTNETVFDGSSSRQMVGVIKFDYQFNCQIAFL